MKLDDVLCSNSYWMGTHSGISRATCTEPSCRAVVWAGATLFPLHTLPSCRVRMSYIYHNSSENVSKNDLVTCCVISFLIPMLLCELTCLKKKKKKRANCLNVCYPPILYCWHMGCRGRVTWLCCQLIARPGNVTTIPLWPDPYHLVTKSPKKVKISILIDNCYLLLLKYHYVLIMYYRTYIMFIIPLLNATLLLYVLFVPMFIGQ